MNVKDYKPGQVVTVPGAIFQNSYGQATHSSGDLESHGFTKICDHALTFTIPEGFNGIVAEINSIDKALGQAADAYHSLVGELKTRKAALLQLGHEQGSTEVVDADAGQTFTDLPTDEAPCDNGFAFDGSLDDPF